MQKKKKNSNNNDLQIIINVLVFAIKLTLPFNKASDYDCVALRQEDISSCLREFAFFKTKLLKTRKK